MLGRKTRMFPPFPELQFYGVDDANHNYESKGWHTYVLGCSARCKASLSFDQKPPMKPDAFPNE